MRTVNVSSFSGTSAVNNSPSNHYSPSVPISVYRELAAELSSTRTQMETYKFQNQQLVEQNQKLRLEIERVVQSTLHLRQVADGYTVARSQMDYPVDYGMPKAPSHPMPQAMSEVVPKPRPSGNKATPSDRHDGSDPVLFTEQPAPQPQRSPGRDGKDLNGWMLALIIGLIVVTAFGTGFLLVRPLLSNR
jgi:hypothetical protein